MEALSTAHVHVLHMKLDWNPAECIDYCQWLTHKSWYMNLKTDTSPINQCQQHTSNKSIGKKDNNNNDNSGLNQLTNKITNHSLLNFTNQSPYLGCWNVSLSTLTTQSHKTNISALYCLRATNQIAGFNSSCPMTTNRSISPLSLYLCWLMTTA